MNFNAPIANQKMPSYNEGSALAPARDDRNVGLLWKKVRDVQNVMTEHGRALEKTVQQISKMRRKPLGGFIPSPDIPQSAAPCQFYNVTPAAGFAINDGGVNYVQNDQNLTLVGGQLAPGSTATTFTVGFVSDPSGIVINLIVTNQGSYTTSPAYPAAVSGGSGSGLMVTAISGGDAWRTVQMRTGLIGVRSRFVSIDAIGGFSYYDGGTNQSGAVGNYQTVVMVDGDGYYPFSEIEPSQGNAVDLAGGCNPIMLEATGIQTLISGQATEEGDGVSYSQIILNAPNDGNFYQAAFWLEIVDAPAVGGNLAFFSVNLIGRMYLDTGNNAFPNSDSAGNNANIIPLAIVQVNSNNPGAFVSPSIGQFVSGSILNLFDSYFNNSAVVGGSSGLAVGSKCCFRGDWTADNLGTQFFYPGDMVRDIPPLSSSIGLTNTLYVCLTYLPQPNTPPLTAPHLDGENWLCLMS